MFQLKCTEIPHVSRCFLVKLHFSSVSASRNCLILAVAAANADLATADSLALAREAETVSMWKIHSKVPKKKNIGNPWKSIQIYGDPHVIPLYFYIFPDMSSSLLVAIGQVDPKGERTLGVLTKTVGIPAALSTRESGFRLW